MFGGVAKTAASSAPSSSPFGTLAWGAAAPSAPAHSTNSSSSNNPFARASALSTTTASVPRSAGAFGSTTAPFGTNPFGPSASPFGRPTATGFRGFGSTASETTTVSTAGSGQATTGWFPLGGAYSAAETESPFGRPSVAASAQKPLGFFHMNGATSTSNANPQLSPSPFGLRAAVPVAAETNPFAAARSGGSSSEQSRGFSSLWQPHNAATSLQSADASTSLLQSRPQPVISFTTGAWQTRPALFAAAASSGANAVGTRTETRRQSIASSASLDASSAAGTGFRFTFTPSWQLKPAAGAPQTALTGCFRFPTSLTSGSSSELGGVTQPLAPGTGWASRDIDTSAARSSMPVATGFDVTLSKAVSATEPQQQYQQQEPPHLVAQLDVSPYGAGSFGAGRLESVVKAALSFQQACSETANFLSTTPKPKSAPMRNTNLGLPTRPLHCAALKPDWRRVTPARRTSTRDGLPHGRILRFASLAPSPSRVFRFKSSLLRDVAVVDKEAKDESESESSSSNSEPLCECVGTNGGSTDSEVVVESDAVAQRASATSAPVATAATAEDEKRAGEHESEPNAATPASSACPVLTASHISTVPEYAQLQRMSSEDLAHVDGFAVCSDEFGEIEWPGLTDVRGLNLDEILLFSDDEVAVYPEECASCKPEVGAGLNKRAILRLRNIYPSDANRRPGADTDAVTAAFVERLKKRTADLRAEFLGYEAVGGVWKLQVEHF